MTSIFNAWPIWERKRARQSPSTVWASVEVVAVPVNVAFRCWNCSFCARRTCRRKGVSRAVGFSSAFSHNREECPRRLQADNAAFNQEVSDNVWLKYYWAQSSSASHFAFCETNSGCIISLTWDKHPFQNTVSLPISYSQYCQLVKNIQFTSNHCPAEVFLCVWVKRL